MALCAEVRAGGNDVAGGGLLPTAGDEERRQILATWLKFSSTGVSRPKIDTSTLSFC
ncbi:hypothetical protein GA0070216_103391 [Micromonospora matsumotoense]|uniref:Uncharacterized protein n=1 Tax=Micromonospora matsumotoense TaxID=121616 RepID=A0A1C4WJB9_9ACTN|nr:hypothetical protein GA0070216_103391 [Micromonospora matsumotoense]